MSLVHVHQRYCYCPVFSVFAAITALQLAIQSFLNFNRLWNSRPLNLQTEPREILSNRRVSCACLGAHGTRTSWRTHLPTCMHHSFSFSIPSTKTGLVWAAINSACLFQSAPVDSYVLRWLARCLAVVHSGSRSCHPDTTELIYTSHWETFLDRR